MTKRNSGRVSVTLTALAAASFALSATVEARLIRDHRDPSTGGGVYTLNVTPVVDVILPYPAGTRATCATSNPSANADPVLHVLAYQPQSIVQEIARDDDSGGNLNARVSFTVPANGKVRVVMRAAGAGATGTADLSCDRFPAWRKVAVGGAFKRVESYRKYENLLTVPLPGGPNSHRFYMFDADTGQMLRRDESGASQTVLFSSLPTPTFVVMLGSYASLTGDSIAVPPTGGVLERAPQAGSTSGGTGARDRGAFAGTATTRDPGTARGEATTGVRPDLDDLTIDGGVTATRLSDKPGDIRLIRNDLYLAGHDADGDGLGNELEANIGTCSNQTDVIGNWECSRTFDPRDTDGDGLTDRIEVMGMPEKAPYQLLPRWGADPRHKDLFLEVDFMQREANETPRKMPNSSALGLAAAYGDPETSALYRLAHAQSLNNPDVEAGISFHIDTGMNPPAGASVEELATYGDWGGWGFTPAICDANGECKGNSAGAVWQTMMHERRRGVFHYGLGYPGGGGQAGYHTFVLNIPIDHVPSAAHELGHTLGLTHGGPEGIGADANCKPNYPSVMSYSYSGHPSFTTTFSDGYGRSALNNTELREQGAVTQPSSGPGKAYLTHLRDIYKYNVNLTTGDVDWNRDGVISTTPVKAYANNDHSSCEFTRVNQMNAAGLADGAVTLTRLGQSTIVLYVDENDRRIHLEHTTNNLACPANTENCGPALQQVAVNASWNVHIDAIDAHPIGTGSQKKLLVVFRKGAGLFETTMSNGFVWSAPVSIAASAGAMDELSLAGSATESFLAYKDTTGRAALKRRDASGAWGADEIVTQASGSALNPLGAGSSPGILLSGNRLFGAFPVGPSGVIGLYERNAANGRWSNVPWQMNYSSSIGRPALAMEPVAGGSPMPGRMRLIYISRGTEGKNIIRIMTLEAIGLGASAALKMTDEIHDNVWYFGNGVDLLFEQGVDTNLRAAVASALRPEVPDPHFINLRPKADGVVFQVYRNWNDWEALGIDLCRTLKQAGAQVNCPAWPYTPQSQPTPPSSGSTTPPPTRTPQQCIADCRDIFDSCKSLGEGTGICVKRQAQCIAQCRR